MSEDKILPVSEDLGTVSGEGLPAKTGEIDVDKVVKAAEEVGKDLREQKENAGRNNIPTA